MKQSNYVNCNPELSKDIKPVPSACIIDEEGGVTIIVNGEPFISLSGVCMEYTKEGLMLIDAGGKSLGFMQYGEGGNWRARIVGVEFTPITQD